MIILSYGHALLCYRSGCFIICLTIGAGDPKRDIQQAMFNIPLRIDH
jgi:hypothetical protein